MSSVAHSDALRSTQMAAVRRLVHPTTRLRGLEERRFSVVLEALTQGVHAVAQGRICVLELLNTLERVDHRRVISTAKELADGR